MDTEERTGRAIRVTWLGFILNVVLSLLKIAAGILGRSSAMIADGIHSISDFATDLGVIFGFHMVKKPVDEDQLLDVLASAVEMGAIKQSMEDVPDKVIAEDLYSSIAKLVAVISETPSVVNETIPLVEKAP